MVGDLPQRLLEIGRCRYVNYGNYKEKLLNSFKWRLYLSFLVDLNPQHTQTCPGLSFCKLHFTGKWFYLCLGFEAQPNDTQGCGFAIPF